MSFLNGELDIDVTVAGSLVSRIEDMRIGSWGGDVLPHFDGFFEDFRVSSVARYTEDFTPTSGFEVDANTVALWTFNEGTGSSTTDAASAHTASFGGSPAWSTDCPDGPAFHTLTCSIDEESTDADGDEIRYTFDWDVDGSEYTDTETTTYDGDTIPTGSIGSDETWTCSVTPNDGEVDGPAASVEYEVSCYGAERDCPAASCKAILDAGLSVGDGTYWLDPNEDGSGEFEAYCDMSTDGGGWSLVMTSSDFSEYEYGHSVWTASDAAGSSTPSPLVRTDTVSDGFYQIAAANTRLCLERYDTGEFTCHVWSHERATPVDLVNAPVLPSAEGADLTIPDGIRDALPSSVWSTRTWPRMGWSHGISACGGLRVGFSGDGDGSDSIDSMIGIGISNAPFPICGISPIFPGASGYIYYHSWTPAPSPHHAGLAGQIWIR